MISIQKDERTNITPIPYPFVTVSIVLGIALVVCVAMWAIKAPSWLIIMTAISFALAGCFILIFAGKFNYQNTDAFNVKENEEELVETDKYKNP